MSIASRIESIENHLSNDYTEIARLGADLTNVDKNIENIAEAVREAYSKMPKVLGTGSNVSLSPTLKGGLDITPIGNCEQDSYSGKNLIGLVDGTYTAIQGEITAVVSNGVITLNGTTTQTNLINITANTNYSSISNNDNFTVSLNNPAINADIRLRINTYAYYDTYADAKNKVVTYTYDDTHTFETNVVMVRVSDGVTLSDYTLQPQLEKGSTATSWEKYVGGIPSPNPSFPQDIRVVTGDNDVKVQNKNLIVKTDLIDGYRLDSSGQPYASETQTLTPYIPVKPNTQYHRNSTFNTSNPVCLYDKNKTFISRITTGTTFTTTSETYYIRTAFFVTDKDTEQLELGNTETTYVEGKSQKVTLHNVPNLAGFENTDYVDTIEGYTDNWKIARKVGKVVLDGTEEYDVSQSGSLYRFAYYPSDLLYINALDNNVRSNYFHAITTAEKGAICLFRNRFFMYPTDDTITDVPAFKNWLTNHNTLVYYPLATPIEETITDTTLINDLNNMYNLMGYDGQTNITISSNSANAQMTAQVSALKGD